MKGLFRNIALLLVCALPFESVLAIDAPSPKGLVSDYADVLSAEEEAAVEASLKRFATIEGKPEVAILTVPDTGGADIESYSLEVARTWGVGKKDANNGVLITVATHPEDAKAFRARIEIGYGLEGDIPDIKARAIYEETMRPHFKKAGEENYVAAFTGASDALYAIMTDGKTGNEAIDNPSEGLSGLVVFGLIVAFFIVAIHWLVGIGLGGIVGWLFGASMSLAGPGIVVAILIGAFVGWICHFVSRAIMEAEGGGGSGGSFGSGSSNGGFGGFGGGSFGGGGFSGGR